MWYLRFVIIINLFLLNSRKKCVYIYLRVITDKVFLKKDFFSKKNSIPNIALSKEKEDNKLRILINTYKHYVKDNL